MSSGTATDPTHPIFNGPYLPCGLTWTGTSFTHAKITGSCLTTLIDDTFGASVACAEKHWGAGTVIFGSMTVTGWHSPFTQARNMRQNILSYLYNYIGVNAGDFTYADSIYCTTDPDPSPIFDPGADTGVFTATPAGLIIDPATGTVDLSLSAAGTYVITNGGMVACTPSSFTMIIGASPKSTYLYSGSPFCTNDADPAPVFIFGGVAGAFTSAPGGLSINPVTGVIDVSASTPGTYTVTNSVTSLYCGVDTHDVIVVINPSYAQTINAEICGDITYTLPDGTIAAATGTYVAVSSTSSWPRGSIARFSPTATPS